MRSNLKNKTLSLIAIFFAFIMASNSLSFAAEEPSVKAEPIAEADKTVKENVAAVDSAVEKAEENIKAIDAEIASVKEELSAINEEIDKNTEEKAADEVDSELGLVSEGTPEVSAELEAAKQTDENTEQDVFADVSDDDIAKPDTEENLASPEAPKSPLENFGNSILSKVDNDLFNKMSSIEKQTTLLRLEYKREELKNKVAALRAARLRAMEEESERKRALENKIKDEEAARQAKVIEEQRKLEERKIELEKLRQAKVLNDYMNEMLMENQKWIENNAKLQGRINELQDERTEMIGNFKSTLDDLTNEINNTREHAALVVKTHSDNMNEMKDKVSKLEDIIRNREEQIRVLKNVVENPFGENGVGNPAQSDVDLSKEYAIMDITGQGDQVVAKLVSLDGTTFSVHKGSMLKNGEVVTAITDTYIAFDKKGVKSYLYTGGTIREYEPQATFKGTSEDFFGPITIPAKANATNSQNTANKNKAQRTVSEPTKPATESGMFVR